MSRQINQDFVERERLRKRRSLLEQINPLKEHLEREKRRKIERATKALSRPLYFPKPVETSELERANLAKAAFVTHNTQHLTEEAYIKTLGTKQLLQGKRQGLSQNLLFGKDTDLRNLTGLG